MSEKKPGGSDRGRWKHPTQVFPAEGHPTPPSRSICGPQLGFWEGTASQLAGRRAFPSKELRPERRTEKGKGGGPGPHIFEKPFATGEKRPNRA